MMTMKAIREEIARQRKDFPTLTAYFDEISYTIETLWKDGYITHFSKDILRMANSFFSIYDFGDEFFVNQTLNLHSITASKKATKAFAEYILTF